MRVLIMLLAFLVVAPAGAQQREDPPLPRQRPSPQSVATPEPAPAASTPAGPDAAAPETVRPPRIFQTACPAILDGSVRATLLPPLAEGLCGARSPYEVTAVSVAGRTIPLSSSAVLNCQMATGLAAWVARVDAYAEAVFNAGIAEVRTGTSYTCRGRNGNAAADLSEHGFANALDVTGFVLKNGQGIGLPGDWGADAPEADLMRHAHDTACGHFTTVLGPEANALHADHLHLDMGCHGRTCTARLCQ